METRTRTSEVDYCLNPRDLCDGFTEDLLKLDKKVEFLVIVLDPRDKRSMTIRSRVHPMNTLNMVHHTIDALVNFAVLNTEHDDGDDDALED